ncbi:MAG: hypothetical protein KDA68_22425 [Planctomycetaceae bacterium]|nr:hypothetical protein [Planctomycetaceae bacterium]
MRFVFKIDSSDSKIDSGPVMGTKSMSDTARLLELIEDRIVAHGGELGGWTRLDAEELQLFDGRVTLRAEMHESPSVEKGVVHVHVLTKLHEFEDEILDACMMGADNDLDQALADVASKWIMGVAGPIKSFIDGNPVCLTCQAGVVGGDASKGFSPGDYGLTGLRAYVGPVFAQGVTDKQSGGVIESSRPWFRYAAESAAPRRIHLAKVSVLSNKKNGWKRTLEVDGHEVFHVDEDWPGGIAPPEFGYFTRFAIFEFPRNSKEIQRRAELEKVIVRFAERFSAHENVNRLEEEMVGEGFDADLVHEVESLSTLAFGRIFFEQYGLEYSSTVIRARRDGRIETDVPLMTIPAYTRARVLAVQLRSRMSEDDFRALCLYNAESNAILKAMEAGCELSQLHRMKLFPVISPDLGVTEQTMDRAFEVLNHLVEQSRDARKPKKPWWKFW